MTAHLPDDAWVPEACALPTAEQPLRTREFDDLFASDAIAVHRESPSRVRLDLRPDPEVAARAADLAAKETDCCSFFAFGLEIANGALALSVEVGDAHQPVLAALATRAEGRIGTAS